jgi:hypothetical protein
MRIRFNNIFTNNTNNSNLQFYQFDISAHIKKAQLVKTLTSAYRLSDYGTTEDKEKELKIVLENLFYNNALVLNPKYFDIDSLDLSQYVAEEAYSKYITVRKYEKAAA